MSLIALPAFLRRRREDTPMPETTVTTDAPTVLMRFLTQAGAVVELYRHAWTEKHYSGPQAGEAVHKKGFEWSCGGCDMSGAEKHLRLSSHGYDEYEPRDSRDDANEHAGVCWSMSKPDGVV